MSIETHQQVTILIEKLNRDWSRAIKGNRVSRLDKDILIEDIRQLYDLMHEVETGNRPERQAEEAEREAENTADVSSATPQEKPTVEDASKPGEIREKEPGHEEKPDEKKEPENQTHDPGEIPFEVSGLKETEGPEKSGEPKNVEETKPTGSGTDHDEQVEKSGQGIPQFTSDKFQASETLADVYRKNGDKSIAARMQKNRITDLKPAIGINDKFLFINDIFKGRTSEYKNAIDKLNRMDHYHEAIEYLNKIKEENDVQNQEAAARLVELIKRRFQ